MTPPAVWTSTWSQKAAQAAIARGESLVVRKQATLDGDFAPAFLYLDPPGAFEEPASEAEPPSEIIERGVVVIDIL